MTWQQVALPSFMFHEPRARWHRPAELVAWDGGQLCETRSYCETKTWQCSPLGATHGTNGQDTEGFFPSFPQMCQLWKRLPEIAGRGHRFHRPMPTLVEDSQAFLGGLILALHTSLGQCDGTFPWTTSPQPSRCFQAVLAPEWAWIGPLDAQMI